MINYEDLYYVSGLKRNKNFNLDMEAYFGKSGNLANVILDMVKDIRRLVLEIDNTGVINYSKNLGLYRKKLGAIQEKYGKIMARTINIENCYISFLMDANAAAMPCCYDSELMYVDKKTNKLEYNEQREIQLTDVIIKSDGYRFKNPDKITFLIYIGLGLFDKKNTNLTDEEITGIMLHEIGHSFQHTVIQINANLAVTMRIDFIKTLSNIINMFIGKIGKNAGLTLGHGVKYITLDDHQIPGLLTIISKIIHIGMILISPIKNTIKGEKGAGLDYRKTDMNLPIPVMGFNRKATGEILRDNSLNVAPKMILKKVTDFFEKILFIPIFIARQLFKLLFLASSSSIHTSIQTLGNAFIFLTNKSFLNRNKTAEEFADTFATFYGYGPEVASGLMKLHTIKNDLINVVNNNFDYGVGNIVYLVPVVNIYLTLINQFNMRTQQIIAGYPMLRERVAGNFKVLQNELNTNKGLTAKEKKDIQEQMDKLRKLYDELVYSKNLSNLVYMIYAKIVNKQIENERTSIEENVLSVLNEIQQTNSKKVPKNSKMYSFIQNLQADGVNFLQKLGAKEGNVQFVTESSVQGYNYLKMLDVEVRVNGKEMEGKRLDNASFEGYNIDEHGKLFIYFNK